MLLILLRLITSIFSWAVLAMSGYLLWTYSQGQVVLMDGTVLLVRHDWMLWLGLALLTWTFLGRLAITPLLARPDTVEKNALHLQRENGRHIDSESGASLYVETIGPEDAQPIVFTHGWGLDGTIWDFAKRELSRRYRLIIWDLPGLGRSKAKEIDLTTFASDLRSVIIKTTSKPPVLVGHSIGGMTIQTLAKLDPTFFREKLAGVVLLNTTYTRPQETMILSSFFKALRWPVIEPMMYLTIWLEPFVWLSSWQSYFSGWAHLTTRIGFSDTVTRSQLEKTTFIQTCNRPGIMARGDLAMFRWNGALAASKMDVPMLVIGGSADIITKPIASELIVNRAPHAELTIVEGANHMGPIDHPDVYVAAIETFVENLGRRAAEDETKRLRQALA